MNGVSLTGVPSQWQDYVAAPGTANATLRRNWFISQVHTIAGGGDNVRLLWLPPVSATTPSTSAEKDATVLTYDATIVSRISALGNGVQVSFAGTSDEADTPDTDGMSFGEGFIDQPMTIFALVNQTATATIKTVLSKYDLTTGVTLREWWFYLDAAEKFVFECYDESAATKIGRTYNTALATATWMLLTATYDGSRAASGIALYQNEARIDDTDSSSGTYVAMQNTNSLTRLGFSQGAAAGANFFNGSLATVGILGRAIEQDEVYALMAAVNSFFNLSLS